MTALLIGLASLAIIVVFKRVLPKVPGVLVAVVGATAAVGVFDLAERAGLSVVGVLPQGLPPFTIPSVTASDIGTLVIGAVGIAIVAFADTSVLSRTFALRGGYEVDPDQELVALGAANIASGLFQGFAISSSSSRTPVAAEAGAKTQVTGLVGAGAIVVLLVAFPNLVQSLPSATLAAVVIAAAFSLVEIAGVRTLYRLRRSEFVLSMVCFLGVAVAGVIPGVFIAVGLALLSFIQRAWRPYDAVLGRIDGQDGYHDVSRHPEAQRLPGLCCSVGTRPSSSLTPESSRTTLSTQSGTRPPRCGGSSSLPSRSPTSIRPRPIWSGNSSAICEMRESGSASRK